MIKYKKKLCIVFVFFSALSWGQTGINTRTPAASSALDVSAIDRGVLLPQYTLGSLTDAVNPVNTPIEGSLIYNIGGVNPKGYYYWTGLRWERMIVKGETDQILNVKYAAYTPTNETVSLPLIPNGVTTANIVQFPSTYTTVVNTIVGVNYTSGPSILLPKGSYRVDITFDCMSPADYPHSTNFETAANNQLFVVNAGIVNSANGLISDLKVASTISEAGDPTSIQGYRFSYFFTLTANQSVKVMLNHNDGASDSTLTRDNQAGLIVTFYKMFE